MSIRANRASSVALLFAGCLCSLPYLVPYHEAPVASFYAEWLAAALAALVLAAVAFAGPSRPSALEVLLTTLALWVAAHAYWGAPAYPQASMMFAAYVVLAAAMLWSGRVLGERLGVAAVCDVVAVFIAIAAVLNALAAFAQALGHPPFLDDWVAHARGPRLFGNIAQPNLFANYLALGEVALLYVWMRQRVSTSLTAFLVLLLACASALSASRMALIYPFVFLACARSVMPAHRSALWATGTLVLVQWTAHVAVPAFRSTIDAGSSIATLERAADGSLDQHLAAWETGWHVFQQSPFWGVGPGEFAGAAFDAGMPPAMAGAGTVWTSAHNIFVQLAAETGVVGLALLLSALIVWMARMRVLAGTGTETLPRWFAVCLVGVTLVQSLVEYPLWSADFLEMTALMMGIAVSTLMTQRLPCWKSHAAAFGIASLVLCGFLGVVLRDYWTLDLTRVSGTGATLRGAVVADAEALQRVAEGPLAPLAEIWMFNRVDLDRTGLNAKLDMSGRVIRFWPSPSFVARRVGLLVLDGQQQEALRLIELSRHADGRGLAEMNRVLKSAQASEEFQVVLRRLSSLQ